MIININITEKVMGSTKLLLKDLSFTVSAGEKLAIVGRNGVGKTTLFNVISGQDDEFSGAIEARRGSVIIATKQEHHEPDSVTAMDYITAGLPHFASLKHIIYTYPKTMGEDMAKISAYTDAITRFSELGYYDIAEAAAKELAAYQISPQMANASFNKLSGGQKRFIELVRVTLAKADLALIDEPTNHMDYVAKAAFIEWLKASSEAVVVISHDRDVLRYVDRIIEIKDKKAHIFPGNYDAYLQQNSTTTVTAMNQYEVAQRTIENIKKQIEYARSKKSSWGGTADKKNPFVVMEERLGKELKRLQTEVQKPSVWIDQESVENLNAKIVEKYDRYKDKNIRIGTNADETRKHHLLSAYNLSLGYDHPLFEEVTFQLSHGDRLQLRGRNGVGKSTIIKTILATSAGLDIPAKLYAGHLDFDQKLRIGFYEQEIDEQYFTMTLGDAITQVYRELDLLINDQKVRGIIAQYLFDPRSDLDTPINRLSGGQKARFQIIKMLAGDPNLLILDEPTNHLDLPSIEELEKALAIYTGAILYVSHDSYFDKKLGGETVEIKAAEITLS